MTNGTIKIKANDKIDLLYFIALHLLIEDKNTKNIVKNKNKEK